jgi:hypothetical protein
MELQGSVAAKAALQVRRSRCRIRPAVQVPHQTATSHQTASDRVRRSR